MSEQEIAGILSSKIDYEAINRLVALVAQDESLNEEEQATMRIRVIQMLMNTARWYGAFQSPWKQDSMDSFHNGGYAGI